MDEKRKVARVAVDWKVSLRLSRQVAHGRVVEFSEYGMLAVPPDVAQAGQRYELAFALPGHRSQFRVRGIVVNSSPRGVGIRFESVPPEVTATFRNYMASADAPESSAGPSS